MAKKSKSVTVRPKPDRRTDPTRPVTEIPAESVLAPLQRKGIEGVCIACGEPVSAHYGHRNVWKGCQAKGLEQDTPFILVPARRRVDVRTLRSILADGGSVEIRKSHSGGPRREVLYVADGRVKVTKITSPRLQQVFSIVRAEKKGIGRKDLLKRLRASNNPGRVDGAVRRLVITGALHAKPVELPEA